MQTAANEAIREQSAERWFKACSTADVSEDTAKKIDIEGFSAVAIFKIGEQFYAIADLCTHGAASLSEGFVENGIVECPFHSGTFDIKTGQALTFPCTEAVNIYPVRVEGGEILIRLDVPSSTAA
ncbi:MAG: non-heme iron oxygenase ferredoxin subunit [Reyranella sp.]|uniref:non-heme iron oxygenase ferredoxin subunit n=1 Tax=Reyranella sp. TaxID=1929291 RepID=UPI00272FDE68|nr:non-heme iron oxygenase ferredoxin subunit [Reyranella sp.]MDP1963077.1 non-heme iron oxygenase ferredoxin subunit [Reyranella sp.]MDP2378757.1 non-heme iron oxygenase ferredoxin subunit [Reyranella sp.]